MKATGPEAASDQLMRSERGAALGGRTASGVVWMTAQRWAIRLSGFATIAILTRFLSPEDFGAIAAATTVLPFFILLSDLGFAAYIVQAKEVTELLLSTSFWFSCLASIGLCVTLVAVAPVIGPVFGSRQVVPVLQVLSLAVLFAGASSVPISILRRSMRFKALAAQGVVAAGIAQLVAIVMTLSGLGVWALVGQALASPFATCTFAWFAAKWRPSFVFSKSEFSRMAKFGTNVLGVEFITMGRTWAEAAIVSTTLGLSGLGYLNIAQRLVQVVQDLTGAALVPVSTVAFAKIRESTDRLRTAYIRALRMTYAVLTPPLTLVAVAAPTIIPILFGRGWTESQPVAQILAIAGILVVAANLDNGLFYGFGHPGRWFLYALVVDVCTVAMTALTVHWGLSAVAWGFLVVAGFATVGRWFLVSRLLGTTPSIGAAPSGFAIVAVLTSGTAGWFTNSVAGALPPIARIVLIGLAILIVYLAVVRLMARQVMDDAIHHLSRLGWLNRLRSTGKGASQ